MTFLPIVERELRVAARKKGTHGLHFFAAVAVIALFFVLTVFNQRTMSTRQFGNVIFYSVSVLAFGFTLLAGVFLTSDCLCSEKRDGTLGLLFLTDLNGGDVVLGKLVATSVVSAYALLAIIPVLGLPLLMGGVSGAEFGRMVLVLLVTLLLSLAGGMFASAIARDTRAAMILTFGLMLALTAALFLMALFAGWILNTTEATWILLPSPLLGFVGVSDLRYQFGQGAAQYWFSIFTVGIVAVAFLSMASRTVRGSWQDSGPMPECELKSAPIGAHNCSRLFAFNPFAWLSGRDSFPAKMVRVFLGLLFAVWVSFFLGQCLASPPRGNGWFVAAFFMAFGMHALVKGLMAVQATRRLCEDRQSGALELLLATRLTPSEIIAGQWHTLRRQFKWLMWALVLLNVALICMTLVIGPGDMDSEEAGVFTSIFVGGIVLLWMDFRAIGWVGMWTALSGLRPHRAVMNTLARILGPPWAAIFLFVAWMASSGRGISGGTMFVLWLVWFSFSACSAVLAARNRKSELIDDFRRVASGDKPRRDPDAPGPWSPEWEPPKAASTPPAA